MNPELARHDFPILARKEHGRVLAYLDSAATSQKPRQVIDAMTRYLEQSNANAHRGVYALAEESTRLYEEGRKKIASFIGAPAVNGLIFVRNTTEAINLAAHAWGDANLGRGDVILVTQMEHHSNLVPWHLLAGRTGAVVKAIPITDDGLLDLDAFNELLELPVKLVAVTHVSNVLGTLNPVGDMARAAHAAGARILVDGAQSVPHMRVSVADLDCDFFAFSSHKMLGPAGMGGLWVRHALFDEMTPFLGGGEMIDEVEVDRSTYADPPWRYEAGTQDVAGVVGLSAAVDYLEAVGMDEIAAHDRRLGEAARARLGEVPGLRMFGPWPGPHSVGSVVAFAIDGVHPHDAAQALDARGIAVRAGHHCAQPLMKRLGVQATVRASFYLYNTMSDVDLLARALADITSESRTVVHGVGRGQEEQGELDDELFREVVLDHYLEPEGREPVEGAQVELHGKNPLCGDEVTLRLRLDGDRIDGLQVLGHGCSVSVASGSIMASMLKGRSLDEAFALFGALKSMMHGEPVPEDIELGDMNALRGLKELPVRVKCALLAWTTFEEAVERARGAGEGEGADSGGHVHG